MASSNTAGLLPHTVTIRESAVAAHRIRVRLCLYGAALVITPAIVWLFARNVYIYGKNHSGSSTLQHYFFLFILFGLGTLLFAAIIAIIAIASRGLRPILADQALTVIRASERSIWIVFIAGSLLVLGVGFWCYDTQDHGFENTVGNLVVSAAATVLVAFGGWFAFQLTFGFFTFRRLCAYQSQYIQRKEEPGSVRPSGNRPYQAKAVVQRLKKSSTIFLCTPTTDAAESFIINLEKELNANNIVSLVVRSGTATNNYPDAARLEFQKLLHQAQVPPHPFVQGLEWYTRALDGLALFGKIVVIIEKMDASARTHGHEEARKNVGAHADELAGARLPFIAIVEPASLPPAKNSDSVAITPPHDVKIDQIDREISPLTAAQKARRERTVRKLAVALQPTGLRVTSVYASNSTFEGFDAEISYLDEIIGRLRADGLIRFGSDLVSTALRSNGDSKLTRQQRFLLRAMVERLVISGGRVITLSKLYDDLSRTDRLDVLWTIDSLKKSGLLDEFAVAGKKLLGFKDPRLGEIAIGWWLARHHKPYAFSQHRTALCTSAELFGRLREAASAPYPHPSLPWPHPDSHRAIGRAPNDISHVWHTALEVLKASSPIDAPQLGHSALAAMGGAINAALSEGYSATFSDQSLGEIWDRSDGTTQRAFVERLTPSATIRLASFLWERADQASAFQPQNQALRRSICRKLGSNGNGSWETLGADWEEKLLESQQNSPNLTWQAKSADPDGWIGHSLGSLGWTLPSVVVTATGGNASNAWRLLNDLVDLITQTTIGTDGLPEIDVGMQIALAEGCRDACYLAFTEGIRIPPAITGILMKILRRNNDRRTQQALHLRLSPIFRRPEDDRSPISWYARLIALQGLFIAVATDKRNKMKALIQCKRCEADRHPMVKQYAKLLRSELDKFVEDPHVTIGRYVWLDDNEAVSEAGGELTDDAVQILATVVCLLNFSGGSEALNMHGLESQKARIRGLTENSLPGCFVKKRAAQKALHDCSCDLRLCGKGIYDAPVRRQLSRTFIDRCLYDAPVRRQLSRAFGFRRPATQSAGSQPFFSVKKRAAAGAAIPQVIRQRRALRVHLARLSDPKLSGFKDAIAEAMPEDIMRNEWRLVRGHSTDEVTVQLSDHAWNRLDEGFGNRLKVQGYERLN